MCPDMDNLLLSLLNASDEQARRQRVDELLTIHVAPIIRQVLRRRLNLYVSAEGVNENNYDAEDLYQETMTRMVEVLQADQRSLTTVENLERYAGRIASNICVDFLRSKYPTRARLKDALLYVFRRHRELASWQYKDEILCGFADWRAIGRRPVDDFDLDTKLKAFLAARFVDEDARIVPLSRVVPELLQWVGGPIRIDVMVRMLAHVRDIREQQVESWDDQVIAEIEASFCQDTRSAESKVETNEMLGRLWQIVKRLPPKQRDAFALRFQDENGQDLFTVLRAAGVAEWKGLAEGLERSTPDVVRLWRQMPMDSATAASELQTSRAHVYKWRCRAIQKLKVEL
jgi:RNA polymerase sigma factor (sigma-70 family)